MTKTEHYQLNQWEPGDAVKREDFNADNAAIDAALAAAYSAENKPYVVGTFELTEGYVYGSTAVSFDFTPSFILVSAGSTVVLQQGVYGSIVNKQYYMYDSIDHNIDLKYTGKNLKVMHGGSGVTLPVSLYYVAFR